MNLCTLNGKPFGSVLLTARALEFENWKITNRVVTILTSLLNKVTQRLSFIFLLFFRTHFLEVLYTLYNTVM